MSFNKRIVYMNKYNQRVMVRSVGIGDEHVEITETTNSALPNISLTRIMLCVCAV
ncbi:TPA: hypothetical protein ACSLA8_002663 [Listeria innocua]